MKETIQQGAEDLGRDYITLIFTGLGITFAPHEYLGGMFLALAGASIASHFDKNKENRLGLFIVLLVAFFVAHLVAMISHYYWPELSHQFVMAVAGFGSRYLIRTALETFNLIEKRGADKIANRVLGKDEKEEDI